MMANVGSNVLRRRLWALVPWVPLICVVLQIWVASRVSSGGSVEALIGATLFGAILDTSRVPYRINVADSGVALTYWRIHAGRPKRCVIIAEWGSLSLVRMTGIVRQSHSSMVWAGEWRSGNEPPKKSWVPIGQFDRHWLTSSVAVVVRRNNPALLDVEGAGSERIKVRSWATLHATDLLIGVATAVAVVASYLWVS